MSLTSGNLKPILAFGSRVDRKLVSDIESLNWDEFMPTFSLLLPNDLILVDELKALDLLKCLFDCESSLL